MTDKELLKQAYDALDKITDMFEAVNGHCVIGGDDVYDFAIQAMMQLDERLKQEQEALSWWRYTNAQGKEVIVKADVAPYEDAVPLYTVPQLAQHEPVAEVKAKTTGGNPCIATVIHEIYSPFRERLYPGEKLYRSPYFEQKPWVGLTDEDIEELIDSEQVYMKYIGSGEHVIEGEYHFARNIENKLRRLNK